MVFTVSPNLPAIKQEAEDIVNPGAVDVVSQEVDNFETSNQNIEGIYPTLDDYAFYTRYSINSGLGLSRNENFQNIGNDVHTRLSFSDNPAEREFAKRFPYPAPNEEYDAEEYVIEQLGLKSNFLESAIAEATVGALSSTAGIGAWKGVGEVAKLAGVNPYFKFALQAGAAIPALTLTDSSLRDLIEQGLPANWTLDPDKQTPGASATSTLANIVSSSIPTSAFLGQWLSRLDGPLELVPQKLRERAQFNRLLANRDFLLANNRNVSDLLAAKFRVPLDSINLNARSVAGSVINDLAEFRKKHPGGYYTSEGLAITGGGAAAAAATYFDPGDQSTELLSEIAGSSLINLTPTSYLIENLPRLGSKLFGSDGFVRHPIKKTKEGISKAWNYSANRAEKLKKAQEQRKWDFAQDYIATLLQATDEDPAEIAAYLLENPVVWVGKDGRPIAEMNPNYPGIDPQNPETWPFAEKVHFLRANDNDVKQNAFHQTNSKGLGILQELLRAGRYGTTEQAAEYSTKFKQANQESLNALHTLTSLLLATGDANDVRNALAARELVIDQKLQNLVDTYTERAQTLARKTGAKPVASTITLDAEDVAPGQGVDVIQEGEILKTAALDSLSQARAIERKLYEGLNFDVHPTNTHRALLTIANDDRAEMAGNAPKGYIGADNEPVYGPEGSYDAGEIIGHKKVNPTHKNVTPYGEGDYLLGFYQKLAQRPEEREISAILSQDQIIQKMRDDKITRTNTDPEEYVRLRDEVYGWSSAPREGTSAKTYTYGIGLDDPYLAAAGDIVDVENKTQSMSVRDLTSMRSDLLEKIRKFRANGDFKEANAYGYIADAIQKDLLDYENVFLGVEGLGTSNNAGRLFEWGDLTDVQKEQFQENFINLSPQQQQLMIANQFSRKLHDVFSRSFGSELVGTQLSGAPSVQPEDIINILDKPNQLKEFVREKQYKEAIRKLVLPPPEDGIWDPRQIYDSIDKGAGAKIQVGENGRLVIADPDLEAGELNASMRLAEELRTMDTAYDFTLQSILANRALNPLDRSIFEGGNTNAIRKRMQDLQSLVDVIFPNSVFANDFRNARKIALKLASLESKQGELIKLREAEKGVFKLLGEKNPSAFFNSFFDPALENATAAHKRLQTFFDQIEQFENRFFPANRLADLGISLIDAKKGLRSIILKNVLKNAGNKVKMGDQLNFTPESLAEFTKMLGYSVNKKGDGGATLIANIPFGNVSGAKPLILMLEDAGLVDTAFRRQMELVLAKTEMLRQNPTEFMSLAPEDPFSEWLNNLAGIAGALGGRKIADVIPGGAAGTVQTPGITAKAARKLFNMVPGSEGADILFDLMDPKNKPMLLNMLKEIALDPNAGPGKRSLDINKYYNDFYYKGLYPYLSRAFSPGAIATAGQIQFTETGEARRHPLTDKQAEVLDQTIEQLEEAPEGPPLSATSPESVDVRPIDRPLTMLPRPNIPPPQTQPRSMGPVSPPSPDRMRFAGLFPEDITSGLIQQGALNQGIGSLAG